MPNRILIANRGEIAIRLARTVAEMGGVPLGVHAPDDASNPHLAEMAAVAVLPGEGVRAYLDGAALIAAAQALDADAVHPGYGFLSESAEFASACAVAGLTFIGPAPDTLATFGDKTAAIALAAATGLPVLPTSGIVADPGEAHAFFARHERGVMVKAVGGGGGRGMRLVTQAADLAAALQRGAAEAEAAFGDARVYLEAAVARARHVEVQLIGDGMRSLALGLRECSLQRRRQKLVEIAPPPDLAANLAGQLCDHAEALGMAAGLRGVATVEFLLDIDDALSPWFIEVNARLQVEHTVTEMTTGLDLVRLQIEAAGGASLDVMGLAGRIAPAGCAIQLRVAAERMAADGMVRPAHGSIAVYQSPGGPGVRVDGAGGAGYAPPAGYDTLLAKLIVHVSHGGYPAAIAKARRAAAAFRIEGIETGLPLLLALLDREEVRDGAVDTGFVDRQAAALVEAASAFAPISATQPQAHDAAPPEPGAEPLRAPLTGTVVALGGAAGAAIAGGDDIVVLEAMKMQHPVSPPAAGRLVAHAAAIGETVEEGAVVAWWLPGETDDVERKSATFDPDAIRADLAALQARLALTADDARAAAMAKRHATGLRSARENIADLFDPGSFEEYGGLAVAAQRRRRSLDDLRANTPADGMVAGIGLVDAAVFGADKASVVGLAYDYTVLAGTQGHFNHRKTDRMLDLAARFALPVVFYVEGGGGRPGDVDGGPLTASSLDTTSFSAFARLSGQVPRISIVAGRCFAGNAVFLGCADITIGVRGANIGLGGPAMIEGGGLGVVTPDEIGPAEEQYAAGVLDLLVDDEAAATRAARTLIGHFRGDVPPGEAGDQRALRHLIPEDRLRVYDMRAVIAALADAESFVELRGGYGRGMITGLARVAGRAFGIIANDPRYLGGAIDSESAEKGARFLQLCDAFDVPILSLCDTPGFMVGPASERTAAVRRGSRLFVAAANVRVPYFTIVVRKGYGLGAQAMAGGDLAASATVCAWPTGEFGPMGLEGAVRLGFRRELDAALDAPARDALFAKLVGQMYEKGKAVSVAEMLEIDMVIDPADTRRWLLAALRAARSAPPAPRGGRGFVDVW